MKVDTLAHLRPGTPGSHPAGPASAESGSDPTGAGRSGDRAVRDPGLRGDDRRADRQPGRRLTADLLPPFRLEGGRSSPVRRTHWPRPRAIRSQPHSMSDIEALRAALVATAPTNEPAFGRIRMLREALSSSAALRGRDFDQRNIGEQAMARALADRRQLDEPDPEARLAAVIGFAVLRTAMDRWLDLPGPTPLAPLIEAEFDRARHPDDPRRLMLLIPERAGPADPRPGSPLRRLGSGRRTTSIDTSRPNGPKENSVVDARARDLLTDQSGGAGRQVHQTLWARIAPNRELIAIEADPFEPRLTELLGSYVGPGFRARMSELLHDHVAEQTLLHALARRPAWCDLGRRLCRPEEPGPQARQLMSLQQKRTSDTSMRRRTCAQGGPATPPSW